MELKREFIGKKGLASGTKLLVSVADRDVLIGMSMNGGVCFPMHRHPNNSNVEEMLKEVCDRIVRTGFWQTDPSDLECHAVC